MWRAGRRSGEAAKRRSGEAAKRRSGENKMFFHFNSFYK
jgi:hypothetical protein